MTTRRVQPWRDGDELAPCALCSCCGYTFRTAEIAMHLAEAHLGSREMEQQHLRDGARLLMLAWRLDNDELGDEEDADDLADEYSESVAAWVTAEENRQKTVRGDGTFHPSGVLP